MSTSDNRIREIFSRKLSNVEADVPAHLWDAVASNLPAAPAAGVAAKVIGVKAWMVSIASVVVVGSSLVWFALSNEKEPIAGQQIDNSSIQEVINQPIQDTAASLSNDNNSAPATTPISTDAAVVTRPEGVHTASTIQTRDEDSATLFSRDLIAQEAGSKQPIVKQPIVQTQAENTVASQEAQVVGPSISMTMDKANPMRVNFSVTGTQLSSYNWELGDGTRSQKESFVHTFDQEGTYTVRLTSSDLSGNTTTVEQSVKVYPAAQIFIPNVFTPNGDGLNDWFDPEEKSANVQWQKLIILDNQGIVYESSELIRWDGNDQTGKASATGTYYYLVRGVDRGNEIVEKTGSFNLLR